MKYIVTLLMCLYSVSLFAEPENLNVAKKNILIYHDSGRYMDEVATVDHAALIYLKKRIAENKKLSHPKKLAVVFDIDETSLSNWKYLKAYDFASTPAVWRISAESGDDPAISSTLKLYQYAITHEVAVFFVTGRSEATREMAEKNLREVGYDRWTAIYLKPNHRYGAPAAPYKIGARREIVSQGYDIIFTIGDQESDLVGGFADQIFKLPNPFYYVS